METAVRKGPLMSVVEAILGDYVETPELAAVFNRSTRTIDRWVDLPDGLPVVRIGNKRLFNVESVRKWLADREAQRNPIIPERRGRRSR